MFITVSSVPDQAPTARFEDGTNLRDLKIVAEQATTEQVAEALQAEGWGTTDAEHAWLNLAALRGLSVGAGTAEADFDGLVAYATNKGWISEDGASVRAHIESVA